MNHPHYRLTQLASDYRSGNAKTKDEFIQFLEKEILSILQKHVKKSREDLSHKIEESKKKIFDAIVSGSYDSEDVKKWVSTKVTPIARGYAEELKRIMKEQKTLKQLDSSKKEMFVPESGIVPNNIDAIHSCMLPGTTSEENEQKEVEVTPIKPRPYQLQALEKMYGFVDSRVANSLSHEQEIPSAFLLHQTMGTGKTIEMGIFMERFAKEVLPHTFPEERLRVLVLSNKIETIQWQYTTLFHGRDSKGPAFSEEFAEDFYVKEFHSSATRKLQSAILSKGKKIEDHNMMIISTFQSASDQRIHDLVKKNGPFHIIWVDEGHHLPAAEFNKAATQYMTPHYNGLLPLMPVTTGTSTAVLEKLVGSPLFEYTLPMYLASEYAPYVEYSMIMRPNLSTADIETIGQQIISVQGEKTMPQKQKKMHSIVRDIDNFFVQFNSMETLVDDIMMRVDDLSGTIYFCPSIEFAENLTTTLNKKLGDTFSARSYHSDDRYSDAFQCFRKGELDQIVTIDMLNEAVHPGNVRNIILLRKTESLIVYLQQFGRGLTGTHLRVLDYVASFRNFLIAQDIDKNIQKYRKNSPSESTQQSKKRFSIVAEGGANGNIVSDSMDLSILSVMRKVYELKSGIDYVKATKENIVTLRKKGALVDEDFVHHRYDIKAKEINALYDQYGFVLPESMNGLITALGGNIAFASTHEYVLALLNGVDYIRGRLYVTTDLFIEYVENAKIPLEVIAESKRSDFALAKNATEEFPFLLYNTFKHLCKMIMGIGREGKYSTEMFHTFIKEGKVGPHTPFATLDDYKNLYKKGIIKDDHLRYENWKAFAQNFNQNVSQEHKIKLQENWGSVRQLTGTNDGKYTQHIIQGKTLKKNPSKTELIAARNNGDINISHIDRKIRPSHAEFLNNKYSDGSVYNFTFPLTFDAFIKIMEDAKYKTWYQLHGTHSYPRSYVKTLFDGGDYIHPLPKATQVNYIQLIQDGLITQDMLGQWTWTRFAQSRNKLYGKKNGFQLHESYQSAIANMLNFEEKRTIRPGTHDQELFAFFADNSVAVKVDTSFLNSNFSAAAAMSIQKENMIYELEQKATKAENKEEWGGCLEAYRALKALDPKNELYKNKLRIMTKKCKKT